jgi:hypothetical protein
MLAAFAVSLMAAMNAGLAMAQGGPDPLKAGFENPPNSARPRVWWHWMNGNITREGIKLDLEWMHRVGLGGFQNFDAALGTPQVVEHRLAYMTPEWKDAFNYATKLADQLGMEEAIAGSPGWSETGGPWVPPSQSMKKYVWSETLVEGGKPFSGSLAKPPSNAGAFQNMGIEDAGAMGQGFKVEDFYADSAVVAYRLPPSELQASSVQPKITSNKGNIDTALLADGDLTKTTALPIALQGEESWIQFEYDQPQTIRALTIALGGKNPFDAFLPPGGDSGKALEASDDGQTYRVVVAIPKGGATEHTLSFAPVKAKYFRVTFKTPPPPPKPDWAGDIDMSEFGFSGMKAPTDYQIAELVLHPDARVNRFEEKAAFNQMPDLYEFATPEVSAGDAIPKSDVVDLTGKMRPDGTLDWTPPAGKWVVFRFGYSPLGITNHPATKEATGLEVDKLEQYHSCCSVPRRSLNQA